MVQVILNPLDIPGAPFTWHSGEKWAVAYSFKYVAGAGETVDVYLDFKSSTALSPITIHLAHEKLTLVESDDANNPLTKTSTLTVTVPSTDITADPGTYDLILNVGGQSISEPTAINLQAGSGHFDLVKTYANPDYTSYNGYAEEGTFGFNLGPDEIPYMDSISSDIMVNNLLSESKKKGLELIGYKLYRDTTSAFTTPYQLDITYVSDDQTTAITTSSLALGIEPTVVPQIVLGIILAALILIILVVTVITIITPITRFLFGKGGILAPGSILTQLIPLIIIMIIMKMMMEGMQPAGTPKPVTETVVKGAKAVGRGVVAVGKAAAPVVGGFIGEAVGGPVGGAIGTGAGAAGGAVLSGTENAYEQGYGI
jgi:hypothetical protein